MGLLDWMFGSKPSHGVGSLPSGRFGQDRHKPSGEWVETTLAVPVAGLHHRRDHTLSFFSAAQEAQLGHAPYGVELRPAPDNENDPNAIEVWGHALGKSWHIGFLDHDAAREITKDLVSKDIPIAAELYALWIGHNGHMDVKIIVLAPPGNSMNERLKRR